MDSVCFQLIELEESSFAKDFENPYTNRNPQGHFGIQFWKFHNFRQKEKRQSRYNPLYRLTCIIIFYWLRNLSYHAHATADSDTLYRIIFCWPLSKPLTLAVHSFCLQCFYILFATPRKMAESTDAYRRTDTHIGKNLFREKAVHSSILPLSKVWCLLSLPEAHADDCWHGYRLFRK